MDVKMSITIRTFKILKGRFKIHKDKCILNHNAIFQVNFSNNFLIGTNITLRTLLVVQRSFS